MWVEDVVGITRTLLSGWGGNVVNVCSGKATSLLDAARLAAAKLHVDVEPTAIGGYRAGDMRHCLGGASGLTALLGREPTTLDDGLHEWLA